MKTNCVRDGNGKFYFKPFSNTATRKRPAEAPAVLVLLWFWVKTCNEQPVIRPNSFGRNQYSESRLYCIKKLAIADEF